VVDTLKWFCCISLAPVLVRMPVWESAGRKFSALLCSVDLNTALPSAVLRSAEARIRARKVSALRDPQSASWTKKSRRCTRVPYKCQAFVCLLDVFCARMRVRVEPQLF
jgi:hypothetical protein